MNLIETDDSVDNGSVKKLIVDQDNNPTIIRYAFKEYGNNVSIAIVNDVCVNEIRTLNYTYLSKYVSAFEKDPSLTRFDPMKYKWKSTHMLNKEVVIETNESEIVIKYSFSLF